MTLHQFPDRAQIEGDDYVRGLESRLDRALFDRDGLISQPEAAAWLVRGALAKGDRHRADEVVSATERLAACRPDASVLVLAARHARGVLEKQPTALAEVAGAYPDQRSRGYAAEDVGVVLDEGGESNRAVAYLRQAQSSFEDAGADRDAARVRARLRRMGVSARRPSGTRRATFGWSSLTDTERRIVNLVVNGLTNRETAERLYLSRYTVDFHLRHIFCKLNVSSRVQLTRKVLEDQIGA
jgi:DNA-binding CsgD family transcriptional regulator